MHWPRTSRINCALGRGASGIAAFLMRRDAVSVSLPRWTTGRPLPPSNLALSPPYPFFEAKGVPHGGNHDIGGRTRNDGDLQRDLGRGTRWRAIRSAGVRCNRSPGGDRRSVLRIVHVIERRSGAHVPWSCRCISKGDEPGARLPDRVEHVEEVARRTRQPVEFYGAACQNFSSK